MELTFDLQDFLKTTKEAILKPRILFKRIEKEKNWKVTLSYSIAISVVSSAFGLVQSILLFPLIKNYLPADLQNIQIPTFIEALPAFLLSTIVLVLISFVTSFFLHNWLKLFKVKGDYWDSYKAYVYSRATVSIVGWIPWVGAIASLYSLYCLLVGVSSLYKVNLKKAAFLILPLVIILFFVQFFFFQLL